MKATLLGLCALLVTALAAASSHAQLPCPSCSQRQYMPSQPAYAPGSYGVSPYSGDFGGIPPYAGGFAAMPSYGGYGSMPPQPYGGVAPFAFPTGGGCSSC